MSRGVNTRNNTAAPLLNTEPPTVDVSEMLDPRPLPSNTLCLLLGFHFTGHLHLLKLTSSLTCQPYIHFFFNIEDLCWYPWKPNNV